MYFYSKRLGRDLFALAFVALSFRRSFLRISFTHSEVVALADDRPALDAGLAQPLLERPDRAGTFGNRCPECKLGNVYGQKEPKVLVRVTGQAPLAGTVYSLERLRCGACGQVFTAQEP
jgi:hypothetical protein